MATQVKLVSLNELAKNLDMNKSKLSYYSAMGLIAPDNVIGRMMLFNESETMKRIKKIIKLQKDGLSIVKIKEKLN